MTSNKGEIVLIIEEIVHQIGFAYTTTAINNNKFRTVRIKTTLKLSYFPLSSYEYFIFHIG